MNFKIKITVGVLSLSARRAHVLVHTGEFKKDGGLKISSLVIECRLGSDGIVEVNTNKSPLYISVEHTHYTTILNRKIENHMIHDGELRIHLKPISAR